MSHEKYGCYIEMFKCLNQHVREIKLLVSTSANTGAGIPTFSSSAKVCYRSIRNGMCFNVWCVFCGLQGNR